MRVCRRCGTPADEAAQQAEPICSDHGLVSGHSYIEELSIDGRVVDWMRDLFETFEDVRMEALKLTPAGDSVLVDVRERAVSATMGKRSPADRSRSRTARATWKPSSSGMLMSRRSRSKPPSCARDSASRPLFATRTWCPRRPSS